MRIGGIASGMDTEQIVSDLMRVERMRVDRLFQQEQRLKWRQEAYNDINRKMANFILDSRKAFGLTTTTSSGAMLSSSVNSLKWVKKATSSNESAVKVTANANAMAGTHTVKVTSLANVARVSSKNLLEDGVLDENLRFTERGTFAIETKYGTKKIAIANAKYEVNFDDIKKLDFSDYSENGGEDNSLTFGINAEIITLNKNYNELATEGYSAIEALKDDIKAQLPEGVTAKIEKVEGEGAEDDKYKLVFESEGNIYITASGQGNLAYIGLKEGTIRANNTIDYLVKEINNAVDDADRKSLGLRAAFDKDLGQLMITTRESGKDQTIQVYTSLDADGNPIINPDGNPSIDKDNIAMKIFGGEGANIFKNPDAKNNIGVHGQDAKIEFNGQTVEKATNNFSIYGINLQLQEITTEPIIIHVDSDVDSIFDKIKSFVNEYNKMIDDINGQLGQKYYRDFPPLTSEQKEAMTEKDIELWEEKAKSGLIRNDDSLTRILQTMRINLYGDVEGVNGDYNNITQIGITTGRYQDGGKLVINEEKLRAAINDDPEGIMDLLFKTPDSSVAEGDKTRNTGLVQRIYDTMIDGMKEVVNKSGPGEDSALLRSVRSNILIDFVTKQSSISLLDKDLDNINNRIAREEDLLLRKENRYWQRFTAMEKALSAMQQQSMWLMTQMGLQ